MTQETRYSIFFKGEVIEGANIEHTKLHFAKLFKADEAKLAQLFGGKVIALKRNLITQEAAKFQQLFKKTGAKIYIKQDEASSAHTTPPNPAQESATAVSQPSKGNQASSTDDIPDFAIFGEPVNQSAEPIPNKTEGLTLLPVGSDVLNQNERHEFIESDIDLSEFSIADIGTGLHSVEVIEPPLAPNVDHISTAEVGETLSEPKKTTVTEKPDVSSLSMAEAGVVIETLQENLTITAPDTSHLSMGEVGETIEILKTNKVELTPDISNLSIDEK